MKTTKIQHFDPQPRPKGDFGRVPVPAVPRNVPAEGFQDFGVGIFFLKISAFFPFGPFRSVHSTSKPKQRVVTFADVQGEPTQF